jgi:hypothetical protein
MADGWRNRFMAPVYALVISFGLVFIFIMGAALNDRTRIQFTIDGQNAPSELPQEVRESRVGVEVADDKRQLDGGQLNQSGEFTLWTPDEDIRICMKLPQGWSAVDPKVTVVSGTTCWVRDARGDDVKITLDLRKWG